MKSFIPFIIGFCIIPQTANAFTMPSAPSNFNTTYDEIRTAEGSTCRSANGGNFVVHGGVSSGTADYDDKYDHYNRYTNEDEKGVYLGFAFTYGRSKKIDCTRLADIEFQRAELELQKLRAEIEALKKMNTLQMLQSTGELPELS